MLPFELVVRGIPVSAQTRNRSNLQAWKARVSGEARAYWPINEPAANCAIEFKVTYYYDQDGLDVDNIIKPLQDALVGIVYIDDSLVRQTSSHKRDISDSYRIRGASAALLMGFADGSDFIHIQVKAYTDNGDLAQ